MKKTIILIYILTFIFGLSAAVADMNTYSYCGQPAAGGYSADLTFLWKDPSSATVDYSAGDSVGAATGSPTFSSGQLIVDAATEYYSFDVSSNDIIDAGGVGTIFLRFHADTATNGWGGPLSVYIDYNDYFRFDVDSDGTVKLIYSDDEVGSNLLTHGSTISVNGTVYWARIQYSNAPLLELAIFNDSSGSIGSEIGTEVSASTAYWDVVTPASTDGLQIGIQSAEADDYSIYCVAIYDTVRDTAPDAE